MVLKKVWFVSVIVSAYAVMALLSMFLLALVWPKFRRDLAASLEEAVERGRDLAGLTEEG